MWCQRCGNRIKELFLFNKGEYLCRKCLMYKDKKVNKSYIHGKGEYKLAYNLTREQQLASKFVLECIINKENGILNAITGAGKTEIIYESISYCIVHKLKLGIVIPRKDVVIELYKRISKDFNKASCCMVYGGNNEILYADIIILTSHQLYRYKDYFKVVIIDEVDAFPFYKNEILNNFLKGSVNGSIIYMSATIPRELFRQVNRVFYLNKRYHKEKLDIPQVKYFWSKRTIYKFLQSHKDCFNLIYFPTIKEQLKFAKNFKLKHYLLNSKVKDRKVILEQLHNLDSAVVLTTLVLERGVTFKNSNVIVYKADHELFTSESLVQISGRVGRSYLYPHGKIIFLVNHLNKPIRRAIKFIKKCNE